MLPLPIPPVQYLAPGVVDIRKTLTVRTIAHARRNLYVGAGEIPGHSSRCLRQQQNGWGVLADWTLLPVGFGA